MNQHTADVAFSSKSKAGHAADGASDLGGAIVWAENKDGKGGQWATHEIVSSRKFRHANAAHTVDVDGPPPSLATRASRYFTPASCQEDMWLG